MDDQCPGHAGPWLGRQGNRQCCGRLGALVENRDRQFQKLFCGDCVTRGIGVLGQGDQAVGCQSRVG